MKANNYFKNKVILITGAGSGIGKALCEEIVEFTPKKLILIDIDEGSIKKVQKSIIGVDSNLYKVDVASEKSMEALFTNVIEKNRKIDIVINSAGITAGGEYQDYTFNFWNKIIAINLWGIIYGSTLAYRQMIIQKYGHIVNIASLGGLIPEPMASAYATTKHAVVGLTTTLREEAHAYGIKVSVVCPGVVDTPIIDKATYVGNVDKEKLKKGVLEHGVISANKCAQRIIKGISKNKGIILVKSSDKIFWKLHRFSPGLLSPINRLIAKYFRDNFQKD